MNIMAPTLSRPDVDQDAPSDESLMQRYAAGDAQAFDCLFARHRKSVLAFIRGFVTESDEAEDMLQTVFMRVIRYRKRYRPSAKFTTWLYAITRSVCIDAQRKKRHHNQHIANNQSGRDMEFQQDDLAASAKTPTPRETYQQTQWQSALQEALQELTTEQREVVLLRQTTAMTYAEIGELLGCAENTVKSRMYYGLLNLRRILEQRGISL